MENKEVFDSCDLKAYLSYGSTSNQVKPKMKLNQGGPMGEYKCASGSEVS